MHKLLLHALAALCLVVFAFSASAQSACATVTCDCSNLPVDSWKSICIEKEKQIVASCTAKNDYSPQGFCSIHGPQANRLPLSIDLESKDVVSEDQIVKLNYRIAVLYWSLHKDLDMLQDKVNISAWDKAIHYAHLIDINSDHLFNTQKQVVNSHLALQDAAEAEKSWRDYSEDTLKIGNMLYDYGKAMINAAEAQTDASLKKTTHELAFEMLKISGRMHEQAGYAYANGVRHALAAKTWKQAADITATLSNIDVAHVNQYRQQQAMQLHKASYYWVIGQGENETAISDAEQLMKRAEVEL